jgi:predicted amidophosphoribosyltransferase
VPEHWPTVACRGVFRLFAPPRCLACRRLVAGELSEHLCHRCRRLLGAGPIAGGEVEGIGSLTAAAAYAGPALGLVGALKSGVPAAAETAAELLAECLPPLTAGIALVPVPATRLRRLLRGSDPAEALALALGARLDAPVSAPLLRVDHGRQRGRNRELRLSDPPRFRAAAEPPPHALLIDDVITTGATLTACSRALRGAGTLGVDGAAFARTPPPGQGRP